MRTLLRFGWREILRSKGRAALILLILTVQASSLGGGLLAFDSLFATRDHYYALLRFADLEVQFAPSTEKELPSLAAMKNVPGVRALSRRYVEDGYVSKSGAFTSLPAIVHYLDPKERPLVSDVELLAGQYLAEDRPERVVVERSFAEQHQLSLGDVLVLGPGTPNEARVVVGGIALSPEYLVPTASPDMLIPSKGSLGVVFASRAIAPGITTGPKGDLYNQVVFTFDEKTDRWKTTYFLLAALKGRGIAIERVVPKKANFGYRYVEEILGGSRVFMPMTALLLALMASIVAFLSVSRLIASRRAEIGALLAIGYSPWQFVSGFVLFGVLPGVVAALLSIPGSMAFATNLAKTNAAVAGFPAPIMQWAPSSLAIAGASALLVGLASAIVPSLAILRLRPAHALRGATELRFTGLPGALEHLVRGSTSVRYALRNLFRRARLTLATVTLVALAVAMPAGLLTSLASWDAWARAHAGALAWDGAVSFRGALDERAASDVEQTPGVVSSERYVQGWAMTFRGGRDPEVMRVRGLAVPSEHARLTMTEGSWFSGPRAREAILNTSFLGDTTRPRVGETIKLNFRGKEHELRVVGVVTDASLQTLFVPIETARDVLDLEGKSSGLFVRFDSHTNPDVVVKALRARTDVGAVQVKTEIGEVTIEYMRAFNAIVIPFVALGGILAFLFVTSVVGFLVLERETEYATLRSMGYERAEIARILLCEIAIVGTAGLLVSIVTWGATSFALRDLMAVAWFEVPVAFRGADLAVVALPIAVLLVLAAVPGIRSLSTLDLAHVLRGRALG